MAGSLLSDTIPVHGAWRLAHFSANWRALLDKRPFRKMCLTPSFALNHWPSEERPTVAHDSPFSRVTSHAGLRRRILRVDPPKPCYAASPPGSPWQSVSDIRGSRGRAAEARGSRRMVRSRTDSRDRPLHSPSSRSPARRKIATAKHEAVFARPHRAPCGPFGTHFFGAAMGQAELS